MPDPNCGEVHLTPDQAPYVVEIRAMISALQPWLNVGLLADISVLDLSLAAWHLRRASE